MAHHVLRNLTIATLTLAVVPAWAQSSTRSSDPTEVVIPEALPQAAEGPLATEGMTVESMSLMPLPAASCDALPLQADMPDLLESSGTWLRRGLWYADVDAVIMSRTWDNNGITFVQEFDLTINQIALQNVQQITVLNETQRASLGESSPGYDASARLAIGRFLFRDAANRDHTAEMVVFGGAEWNENIGVEAQLFGVDANVADGINEDTGIVRRGPSPAVGVLGPVTSIEQGLHTTVDGSSPQNIDSTVSFPSFDQSRTADIAYTSRFHSWEWNYSVTERLRKDRLELQPDGQWIRRAAPGVTWEYTAGLRYFDVEERLDWLATDINSVDPTPGETAGDTDGAYNIRTSNNLFGVQLGGGLTLESDRWNVTVSTKQGLYVNDARATTALTFIDPENDPNILANNFSTDLNENALSYIGTGSVLARYYLRPNFSLRLGWEFTYVTGLALAPNLADFNPAVEQLNVTGDVFYHGAVFGTEYYW